MSDLLPFEEPKEEEDLEPALDTPLDMRPDLAAIGMVEMERGVVEDTYENRQILRGAFMNWDTVYSQTGQPTGLIAARSQEQTKERRVLSLTEKKPLLSDPLNNNSDYLTGLDLLVDEAACRITPPWVVGATKSWQAEQAAGGPKSDKRAPASLPHRCRITKADGLRCMLWSSGRLKDDGLCRVHLRTQRKPGEDVERARRKLMQSAPYAVDVMEELMETAVSEPVRLKAASEILDRAGVRGGVELDVGVELTDGRSPAQIVMERLARLQQGAINTAVLLGETTSIQDADVVEAEVEEVQILPRDEAASAEVKNTDEDEAVESDGISAEELDEL
jgi:hypothetical protein